MTSDLDIWAAGFVATPRLEINGPKRKRLHIVELELLMLFQAWANFDKKNVLCTDSGDELAFGEFCFSYRSLAETIDRDHRRVINAVNKLVKLGKIEILKRSRMKGTVARLRDTRRIALRDEMTHLRTRPLSDHSPTTLESSPDHSPIGEISKSDHSPKPTRPLSDHSLTQNKPYNLKTSEDTAPSGLRTLDGNRLLESGEVDQLMDLVTKRLETVQFLKKDRNVFVKLLKKHESFNETLVWIKRLYDESSTDWKSKKERSPADHDALVWRVIRSEAFKKKESLDEI